MSVILGHLANSVYQSLGEVNLNTLAFFFFRLVPIFIIVVNNNTMNVLTHQHFPFLFFFNIFIGVQLLYNCVLVSVL